MDFYPSFNFNKTNKINKTNKGSLDKDQKNCEWRELDDRKYCLNYEEYTKFINGINYLPKLNDYSIKDINLDFQNIDIENLFSKEKDDFSDLKQNIDGYIVDDDCSNFIEEISDDEDGVDSFNHLSEWETQQYRLN